VELELVISRKQTQGLTSSHNPEGCSSTGQALNLLPEIISSSSTNLRATEDLYGR
jgi:hypothetical protein